MSQPINTTGNEAQIPWPKDARIKTIKNTATGQFLSVIPQEVNADTYGISVNDMCLYAYNDKYEVKPCMLTGNLIDPQYFNAKQIINQAMEAKIMGGNTKLRNVLPYTAFQSPTTQQCLTYNMDGLYMAPCNADNIYQRWSVSPNENLCVHE
jgi:hypothetical protein